MSSMAALVLKGQKSRRFYGLGLKIEEISKGIPQDLQVVREETAWASLLYLIPKDRARPCQM